MTAEATSSASGIAQRTAQGIVDLLLREAGGRVVALVGGVLLARTLDPLSFGIFAVASAGLALTATFAELGLGAALIRSVGTVDKHDIDALNTFQFLVAIALGIGLIVAAPFIATQYKQPVLVPVLDALTVSLVLMSLKTGAVIVTERRLEYGPVALAELAGQIAYWSVAVATAMAGWRVWSLVSATLALAVVSTVLMIALTHHVPRPRFDLGPVRKTIRFALKFQSVGALYFLRESMTALVGGRLFGGLVVGYMTWATQLAAVPLLVTILVARVAYPALSRLQGDDEGTRRLIQSMLGWTTRVTLPALAVLAGLAAPLVPGIFGDRWVPAVPYLRLMCLNGALNMILGVLFPYLYARNRATAATWVQAGWVILVWTVGLLGWKAGFGPLVLTTAYIIGAVVAIGSVAAILGPHHLADLLRPTMAPALVSSGIFLGLFMLTTRVQLETWTAIGLAVGWAGIGVMSTTWRDRQEVILTVKLTRIRLKAAMRASWLRSPLRVFR